MNRREEESNLDWFNRYVMNDIPIRLIRLSDMRFVGRNDLRMYFQSSVPQTAHNYHPSNTLEYAILSHRWLGEGEPTYEQIKSGTASVASRGYEKLQFFCDKARAYNVQFAWSDTCCINKSSSTELDESIRSMFRWYKNSTVCIVHLAQSETIGDIPDDEWTQRGWTLQELLASRKIKLFNQRWKPMTGDTNDKSRRGTELMKTLEAATGIPLDSLLKFRPGPVRVDERMTWAARRKTTRVEDVAYSLMGIFDVSLQIAYGEGEDRAFCRLIEAIMQTGNPSVLNWTGEAAMHCSSDAFPRSPQSFAGRTLQLPPSLGRLEMTMTSLGLRVPLVILPLSICSTSELYESGYYEVILECVLYPTIKINFVGSSDNYRQQFALGIVNYSLGSCGLPRIPGKSAGFILQRGLEDTILPHGVYQPSSGGCVGLEIVSPPECEFVQWKKVYRTGLVEVNFPNIPRDLLFYIDRKYLETVYL
ncbi:hypothetical protein K503DRAFT_744950 [Rhizopogon vinicolor AM-OR11-026]|uniref:Heterokaryon incompatibility domain-containing protein n=1 Tax=Rhizopogon vinicolor AM-OR11-026 TaxID=1314800 RepID=A0A1B7MU25_9AGAM|nr:hypothetical protein K503DRAFT_744950 [Rhizopogon vinicolor AM-OR11-026]